MKKIDQHYVLFVTCILTISLTAFELSASEQHTDRRHPRLIAHAGGDYKGVPMTNSVEALNKSVKEGFLFIEIDLTKTVDGIVMLVHDWSNAKSIIKISPEIAIPAYSNIKKAKKTYKVLNLDGLIKWLRRHKDVRIVTDVKDNNLEILQIIREKYRAMYLRFIPQIYTFDEYKEVKNMGYNDIILTLYRLKASQEEVLSFCKNHELFALTVSRVRATDEYLKKCSTLSIPVFVHTINDSAEYKRLRKNGAYGVYTDFLHPDSWIEHFQ